MPLTMAQLQAEGLPAVVSRLVARRHYLLAMRICQTLGLGTEQVCLCQLAVARYRFCGRKTAAAEHVGVHASACCLRAGAPGVAGPAQAG